MDYQSTLMKHHSLIYCLLTIVLAWGSIAANAQNNPYVDDKLLHFGFFLELDVLSYLVEENDSLTQLQLPQANGNVYHLRSSAVGAGFAAGFIADLRLSRHLNLRFTPALHFGERTLQYKSYTTHVEGSTEALRDKIGVLTIPISIPLYLKWSAEREANYRPYVIVGGGVQVECFRKKDAVILHQPFDAFVSAGFGCDFYFRWFKFCPEIKYKIGFLDAHVPTSRTEDEGWQLTAQDYFYTNAIRRLTHQELSIAFNFE